jgi:uncharacterized protein
MTASQQPVHRALCIEGGWEGHEPGSCLDFLTPILEAHGYEIRRTGDLESLGAPYLYKSVDLIVPALSMVALSTEAEHALVAAVEHGAHLIAWHGAATLHDNSLFALMLGGTFLTHPDGMVDYTVNPVPSHAFTEGLHDFPMHSEQYAMHVDPSNTVLATTTFSGDNLPPLSGTVMPVAWTRMWGEGRVFYTSLGHSAHDLAVPQVATLLERAIKSLKQF